MQNIIGIAIFLPRRAADLIYLCLSSLSTACTVNHRKHEKDLYRLQSRHVVFEQQQPGLRRFSQSYLGTHKEAERQQREDRLVFAFV